MIPSARAAGAPSPFSPRRGGLAFAGLAAALFTLAPAAARAEDPAPITIELNRLEPQPDLKPAAGCRAWLLMRNPGAEALDPLRLDLLLFGKDGVIARRLALDVGPLPGAKTMARVFDLSALPCENIGSVLLNDVLACNKGDDARAACAARITTASRVTGVNFEK
ncbi:Tat pathway signal protein [Roseomonas elaeocarpi]|uniref:Tat pathway signal protein n=1 Tax=Roseomonas elaeocarpi TaxID=907779 RepID=A0ABV6JT53_9PROT